MDVIHLRNLEKNSHHKDNRQTYEVKHSAVTRKTENVNLLAAGSGGGGWSKRIWPTEGWQLLAYLSRARNTSTSALAIGAQMK